VLLGGSRSSESNSLRAAPAALRRASSRIAPARERAMREQAQMYWPCPLGLPRSGTCAAGRRTCVLLGGLAGAPATTLAVPRHCALHRSCAGCSRSRAGAERVGLARWCGSGLSARPEGRAGRTGKRVRGGWVGGGASIPGALLSLLRGLLSLSRWGRAGRAGEVVWVGSVGQTRGHGRSGWQAGVGGLWASGMGNDETCRPTS
jgi:hypothetical protein